MHVSNVIIHVTKRKQHLTIYNNTIQCTGSIYKGRQVTTLTSGQFID